MLDLSGRLTRLLAALRQKTKRFPYQIPSSAFLRYQDIRILQQRPPSTRTAAGRRREGREKGLEWRERERSLAAAKSFHILTTFK